MPTQLIRETVVCHLTATETSNLCFVLTSQRKNVFSFLVLLPTGSVPISTCIFWMLYCACSLCMQSPTSSFHPSSTQPMPVTQTVVTMSPICPPQASHGYCCGSWPCHPSSAHVSCVLCYVLSPLSLSEGTLTDTGLMRAAHSPGGPWTIGSRGEQPSVSTY